MATKTVTIDTDEWVYPDDVGNLHTVTNAETFTFELTDDGVSAVKYNLIAGQSVALTDGLRLHMAPDNTAQDAGYIGLLTDAAEGSAQLGPKLGDWIILDPLTHKPTRWRCNSCNVDNADAPTDITATFEQVEDTSRTFTWTNVTIA